MQLRNPFTPTFGIVPPFMAGRAELFEELSAAFANGVGDPNLSSIVYGARGTGKTALLALMAEEASAQGWVCANVTASTGMLEDILDQATIASREFLEAAGHHKLTGITVGQLVAFEWENEKPRLGNWRTQMNALLDQLAEHDVGLFITVDEVKASVAELKQLAQVYQHFVRERRKVALLMAGLPYSVSALLADDDVSFLRRARKHSLGRISNAEIREAMRLTVVEGGRAISDPALDISVAAADGLPYLMQLVGFHMWAQTPDAPEISLQDVERGVERAQEEMVEGVLEYTYRDLSKGDKRFLAAMLEDERVSSITDIAHRMGVKSNYASQYKRRLLEQGIIGEVQRGYVRFDLPMFKEFLQDRLDI